MFEDYEREDLVNFYFEEQMYWQEVAAEEYFYAKAAQKNGHGMGDVDEAYINDEFEFHYSR